MVHGTALIYVVHVTISRIIEQEATKDIRKTYRLVDQRKEDLKVLMRHITIVLVGRPERKEVKVIFVLRLHLLRRDQKIDRGLRQERNPKTKILVGAANLLENHDTLQAIHHLPPHHRQEDGGSGNIQGQ